MTYLESRSIVEEIVVSPVPGGSIVVVELNLKFRRKRGLGLVRCDDSQTTKEEEGEEKGDAE